MNSDDTSTILITGARGKSGRRILDRLVTAGVSVRAAGRESHPRLDWYEPATWPDVLAPTAAGPLAAAYLCYAPDAGFPGADATLGAFARAAADARVGRLVLLTGRGEAGARRSEEAVAAAGVPTTILRSAFFAQGFTEDLLAGAVAAGVLRLPAADVPEPFVDLDDLADVAVAALRGRLPAGVHELTGPQALTMTEVAAILSRTAGHPVGYQPVGIAEFRADLVDLGLPAEAADGLAALFTELFDGRNARPSRGVQAALGREPRPFADAVGRSSATDEVGAS